VVRIASAVACVVAGAAHAEPPCLLANPSFEVGGGLDGWSAFGDVAVVGSPTAHGSRAVSLGGPNAAGWGVSGVWQPHAADAGARFTARVRVGHTDLDPLAGDARAILNIEWRDAADALIAYESHDLLAAGDPTGVMLGREIASGPAPAGTASARLLLGFLQSPAQEPGRVVYDLAGLIGLTDPSYDEAQWGDFPGGATLEFAGRTWRVKGPGFYGPGPNWFGDAPANADVIDGEMRLAIRGAPGSWSSTEVVLEEPLGYGDYVFTTRGRPDTLAPNVVLGLFLWQYPPCYEPANTWNQHNEIDVELSRWGDPAADLAQFVVQPWDAPGNIARFDIDYAWGEHVSYAFRWRPDRVEYRAWRGGAGDEATAPQIAAWTYTGPHLPRPEQPRIHMNLWHLDDGPSDGLEQTVTVADFAFVPLAPTPGPCVGDLDGDDDTDVFDFAVFASGFGDAVEPGTGGDLDADGDIDVFDFAAWSADFGCGR
jgi:hypothetical protein